MRAILLFQLACCSVVLSSGCTSIPRLPIDGRVGLERVRTTVDSELAQYYIQEFLENAGMKPELDSRISRVHARYDPLPLQSDTLRALSDETSPDFAAVYFVRRILSVPHHRRLQEQFAIYVDDFRKNRERGSLQIEAKKLDRYIAVFVPGLFYESRPETKADMAEPRALVQQAGLKTWFVRIHEAGTVEENAEYIATELRTLRKTGKKIILISASKAGPEVAYALGSVLAGQDLDFVRGWVSIGGLLRGSKVADANLDWPKRWLVAIVGWFVGISVDMVESLSTERSLQRLNRLSIPKHVKILHFVGVPLSGTVIPEVMDAYVEMRKFGPNDGVALLSDELLPEGHVILAIGLDHWFRDPEIDLKTLALAQIILDLMQE